MTRSEVALWAVLRRKQLANLRFRRQHPLGPYIVDFYCAARRLAVEVDGAVHTGQRAGDRDAERDLWIKAQGVRVIRVPESMVIGDIDEALRLISEAAAHNRGCSPLVGSCQAVPD